MYSLKKIQRQFLGVQSSLRPVFKEQSSLATSILPWQYTNLPHGTTHVTPHATASPAVRSFFRNAIPSLTTSFLSAEAETYVPSPSDGTAWASMQAAGLAVATAKCISEGRLLPAGVRVAMFVRTVDRGLLVDWEIVTGDRLRTGGLPKMVGR
ncbi:hypothetical protein HKX48_004172 [Thoreauomyces humboldtii]|nr:hypothetical protein HKX48_004172 [Thoreauomyces humboldtii]